MKITMKFWGSILILHTVLYFASAQAQNQNRIGVNQLDVESQQCMICHDGSGGKQIELRPVDAPVEYERGLLMRTKNHSIGMSYTSSQEADPKEYVSPASLNPNIKLVDGKVGCLSCHVAKPQLIASNKIIQEPKECTYDKAATAKAFGGFLCTQCHIK